MQINSKKYEKLSVGELWEEYQKKLANGTDEAYIITGDYVQIQSKEYMDRQGTPLTNDSRKYCGQILPVVQSCKVATDLWYTTVSTEDGDVVVYDDEIACVYRLNRSEELLLNAISYLWELKERDDISEKESFWKDIIGMTDEEIKEYEVLE